MTLSEVRRLSGEIGVLVDEGLVVRERSQVSGVIYCRVYFVVL